MISGWLVCSEGQKLLSVLPESQVNHLVDDVPRGRKGDFLDTLVHPEINGIPWQLEQQILQDASQWLSTNIPDHINSRKL